MKNNIISQIKDNIEVKNKILGNENYIELIITISNTIINAYNSNKKVLLCGNGGSAADAQHIAAELVSRFKLERRGLPAIALTANTSVLTAIGNDYNYDYIFEKQVEAFGQEGDVLIAISTSGNSPSIIKAIIKANNQGLKTVSLLGKDGGKCKDYSDINFIVPSDDTPRIQESHIMVGHIICDIVEKSLFGDENE